MGNDGGKAGRKKGEMSALQWRRAIEADCKGLGVYKPEFDGTIKLLAEVMVQRQAVWAEYEADGCRPVITGINKGGNEYMQKNPLLSMWDDLTKTALSYRRELGLTPAGLKKLREDAMTGPRRSALGEALAALGG